VKYIFTILAVFFVFFVGKNILQRILFFNNFQETIATVTNLRLDEKSSPQRDSSYYATIYFLSKDGEKTEVIVTPSFAKGVIHIGDIKKIYYNKRNPKEILVEGNYSAFGIWIFWSVVSIMFICLAIFFWQIDTKQSKED
jgi:Protein of unknown function (DUF3592)